MISDMIIIKITTIGVDIYFGPSTTSSRIVSKIADIGTHIYLSPFQHKFRFCAPLILTTKIQAPFKSDIGKAFALKPILEGVG